MMINTKKVDLESAKELKIKVPLRHHIQLHSMKVLTGKQISDTVTEALDGYFANLRAAQALPDSSAFTAVALDCA